jgi:hypothetical protein
MARSETKKNRQPKTLQSNGQLDLEIEPLEQRQMLAGNVTAVITGAGDLVITGDSSGNQIDVVIGSSGEVSVVGSGGTTVDASELMGAEVTGDVKIDMGDGNNVVTVDDYGAGIQDVDFKSGAGADSIEISYFETTGNFKFDSGDGNDIVNIHGVTVEGSATVVVGGGNDTLDLDLVTTGKKKNITVSASSGDNTLNLDDVESYAGKLNIKTGSGADTISGYGYGKYGAKVNTGAGNDVMEFSISSFKNIAVATGSGDDFVDLEVSTLYGSTKVATSKGNDTISVEGDSKKLTIAAASGDDVVELDDFSSDDDSAGNVKVALSGGNDTFTFGTNIDNTNVKASGGGGLDELIGDDEDPILKHSAFEEFMA